jgi:phosphoserine phosphatase RsbU/P
VERFCALLMFCAASLTAADVRYHFGDDPRWADPKFDDANWTQAKDGRWPTPPPDNSGIMWVRFRVPVSAESTGPLAIASNTVLYSSLPDQIWVNGCAVGGHGSFPPHSYQRVRPITTVFDVPSRCSAAGQTALVAWRVWYPPYQRIPGSSGRIRFEIGDRTLLRLQEGRAILASRLSVSFEMLMWVGFIALGTVLLLTWRLGRGSREVLWFALYLLTEGVDEFFFTSSFFLRPELSWQAFWFVLAVLVWLSSVALFEFQWAVFGLQIRWLLRLLEAVAAVVSIVYVSTYTPSASVAWVSPALTAFHMIYAGSAVVTIGIALWQFRRQAEIRSVAAAIILWTVFKMLERGALGALALPKPIQWEGVNIAFSDIGDILFVSAVSFLLLRRMWRDWRRAQELSMEFEAASQMQRLLVPPAVGAPGFTLASVYLPAQQVGGDFFWTVPGSDGSLLVVVGDVSGKGLKAAMIVATLAGALRNETSRRPAEVLARLNSVLTAQHGGAGFTTCCALLLGTGGGMTIANAGHVPPYRNGVEVEVESGLPLGLVEGQQYAELVDVLAPGDNLTLVSDGVLEARSRGELYGFERTRALSTCTAEMIAETAREFGQEDDISVITIRREATIARTA